MKEAIVFVMMSLFMAFGALMVYLVKADYYKRVIKRIKEDLIQQNAKLMKIRALSYDDPYGATEEEYALLAKGRYRPTTYYVEYVDVDGKFHAKNALLSYDLSQVVWKDRPLM